MSTKVASSGLDWAEARLNLVPTHALALWFPPGPYEMMLRGRWPG
jgi:hypothetical protein